MGKNNRRKNELFIGTDFLNVEGRTIKHPSLIKYYANINPSKTRESFIELIGVDIETNYKTGDMRLCGFYEGDFNTYEATYDENGNPVAPYRAITDDFFGNLVATIKYAINNRKNLAYWSNLDASQIVKLFIKANYQDYVINDVKERYKKVSGEFNFKTGEWEVRPVILIDTGLFVIGIKNAIRDSIQFFMQTKNGDVKTCWGFNIKALYMKGLEAEADYNTIQKDGSRGRFKWYSKMTEEAHLLGEEEWKRFHKDKEFRDMVLESNKLDAKSAMALGYEIQKDFNEAFKYEDETGVLNSYPTSLISQGAHARSAIACMIRNDIIKEKGYKVEDILRPKDDPKSVRTELFKEVSEKLKSIPLITHLDNWIDKYPEQNIKDLYSMIIEAYSGGQIDAISYGTAKKGWIADIASAYPAVIQDLWDLTDSTVEFGEGEPPSIPYSYTFCRGLVDIPKGVDIHPITIKQNVTGMKDINFRPEGQFYSSYTKEERDFLVSVGATFTEETWYSVVTKGKPAVTSGVSIKLGELRDHYLGINSRTEAIIKRINNSGYGITFEATPIYEDIEGEPVRVGYRAGEFFNPLYASIITARTRIIISKACYEITKRGGQICAIMTDSISWVGTKDMLPEVLPFSWGESGIKLKKTFGYFEEPEALENLVVLGAGLYGYDVYKKNKLKQIVKKRGFNISGLIDDDGEDIEIDFNWSNVLDLMKEKGVTELDVKVRRMISVGIMTSEPNTYGVEDLGRVVEEIKTVPLISGKGKRLLTPEIYNAELLSNNMIKTKAMYLSYNTSGSGYVDGTLSILRHEMFKYEMKSSTILRREGNRDRQRRFYENNKKSKNEIRKELYKLATSNGFTRNEAKRLQSWSKDKLIALIESKLSIEDFLNKQKEKGENK